MHLNPSQTSFPPDNHPAARVLGSVLVFAYGVLLDAQIVRDRCPGAHLVGVGTVLGRKIDFTRSGYATLRAIPLCVAHGALWRVPIGPRGIALLDRFEGVPDVYRRVPIWVTTSDQFSVPANAYVAQDARSGVPERDYLDLICAAATGLGFPPNYVAEIAALDPTKWAA